MDALTLPQMPKPESRTDFLKRLDDAFYPYEKIKDASSIDELLHDFGYHHLNFADNPSVSYYKTDRGICSYFFLDGLNRYDQGTYYLVMENDLTGKLDNMLRAANRKDKQENQLAHSKGWGGIVGGFLAGFCYLFASKDPVWYIAVPVFAGPLAITASISPLIARHHKKKSIQNLEKVKKLYTEDNTKYYFIATLNSYDKRVVQKALE